MTTRDRPILLALVLTMVLPALPAMAGGPARSREVVVTAARLSRDVATTGSTISVLPGADLTERQISRAAAALDLVPGAYVAEAGSPGGPASLFLRGAGSNQTVVLVDGVSVNDPTIGGQFNFYDLELLNVERVEVLRGAASTAHGSDALGGVVNVVTRRGEGDPEFRARAEGGSFGHYRTSLGGSGRTGEFDWSVAAGRDRWRNDLPNHEFRSDTAAGAFGLEPAKGTRVEVRARYFASSARDPWDFPFGPRIEEDPNIERRRRTALAAVSVRQDLGDHLEFGLTASQFSVRSRLTNGPDAAGDPDELVSRSDAEVRTMLATATFSPPDPADEVSLRLMGGFEYEDEISVNEAETSFGPSPKIDRTVRNRAGFLLVEVDVLDRLVLSGGLRRDRNSFFGHETTATASALYRLTETDTTFRANYGEAFRAPKPIEFDDPFVGNADLTSEEAVSLDFGVEQSLLEGDLVVSATAFRLRGSDFIVYDPATFRLENFDRVLVRGLELSVAAEPAEGLAVRGWATVQDARRVSAAPGAEERLPGRPRAFGGADVSLHLEPFRFGLSVSASGDYPGAERITPDGDRRNHPGRKLLVGLRASFRAAEGVTVTGRIMNLLDRDWYASENAPDGLGRGFFLGVSLTF